jgi:predicted hydrocarbon binding protein
MSDQPEYYYPNKMGRIILLALEEVAGNNGVNATLNQAGLNPLIGNYPANNMDRQFPFEFLSQIQVALEQLYGPRGGRGVSLRAGRACFKYGLREFGPLLGFTDLAFRLLPLDARLRQGAENFAEIFNRFSDQKVSIDEQEECFLWQIERCPICWGRHTDSPACHLAVGLLQDALYWTSGGKLFSIEETHCIGRGDQACVIRIDKHAND